MSFSNLFSSILVFCSLYGLNQAGDPWKTVKVTFQLPSIAGKYKIPLTIPEINPKEFVKAGELAGFPKVSIYCEDQNLRICPLFHATLGLVGIRVGYEEDIVAKTVVDRSYFVTGKAFNKNALFTTVFFVNPDSLKGGKTALKRDSLWLGLGGNKWTEIPREESKITKLGFVKQNCFPGMGQHYFYGISKSTDCKKMKPFFVLYEGGQLVGCGHFAFGKFPTIAEPKRNWFETITVQVGKLIMGDYPQCMIDAIEHSGAYSVHIYVTDRTPTCPKPGTG